MEHDSDLNLLSQVQKTLNQNPNANQRELARSANLSLGMTNALLRRFTDKGWLYMKKISTRNIQYVLTADGINELARRSSRYFKRTARLMRDYRDYITKVIADSVNNGCKKVLLVGETDLMFLFDSACTDAHIKLYKTTIIPSTVTTKTLIVFIDKEYYDAALLLHTDTANFVCISEVLRVHEVENQEILCQSI